MNKVLIVLNNYLPGYKAGGPIKSVKNIVESLNGNFNFSIVTSDRDFGDSEGYKNVKKNILINKGKYSIIYTTPNKRNISFFKKTLAEYYDVVYLNSLFSSLSILFILMLHLKIVKAGKIVLVPRGELASSALAIKKYKKIPFLFFLKNLGVYRNIFFQATSNEEYQQIRDKLNIDQNKIRVIPNITGIAEAQNKTPKSINELKIVYIARIHPIKNLMYILEVLSKVNDFNKMIILNIYGPLEDELYYYDCQKLIEKLPLNIILEYKGELPQHEVQSTISQHHLFFLPTKGENYGHSIVESLLTNTPVLISDQTPWNDIVKFNAGKAISLDEKSKFLKYILEMCEMDESAYNEVRFNVAKFVEKNLKDDSIVEKYEELFYYKRGNLI